MRPLRCPHASQGASPPPSVCQLLPRERRLPPVPSCHSPPANPLTPSSGPMGQAVSGAIDSAAPKCTTNPSSGSRRAMWTQEGPCRRLATGHGSQGPVNPVPTRTTDQARLFPRWTPNRPSVEHSSPSPRTSSRRRACPGETRASPWLRSLPRSPRKQKPCAIMRFETLRCSTLKSLGCATSAPIRISARIPEARTPVWEPSWKCLFDMSAPVPRLPLPIHSIRHPWAQGSGCAHRKADTNFIVLQSRVPIETTRLFAMTWGRLLPPPIICIALTCPDTDCCAGMAGSHKHSHMFLLYMSCESV